MARTGSVKTVSSRACRNCCCICRQGNSRRGRREGEGQWQGVLHSHRTLSRPTPPKILRQLLTFVKRNETIYGSPLRLGLTAHWNAIILRPRFRDGNGKGPERSSPFLLINALRETFFRLHPVQPLQQPTHDCVRLPRPAFAQFT